MFSVVNYLMDIPGNKRHQMLWVAFTESVDIMTGLECGSGKAEGGRRNAEVRMGNGEVGMRKSEIGNRKSEINKKQ
jgi:hypothetical protein